MRQRRDKIVQNSTYEDHRRQITNNGNITTTAPHRIQDNNHAAMATYKKRRIKDKKSRFRDLTTRLQPYSANTTLALATKLSTT